MRRLLRVTPAGFDFEAAMSNGSANGIIFERFSCDIERMFRVLKNGWLKMKETVALPAKLSNNALTAATVKANGTIEQATNGPSSLNLVLIE
jgi:hypothetical protein